MLLSADGVKDENGARLMLKEPLIVDIWGEDEVTEFYDVYAKIRDNLEVFTGDAVYGQPKVQRVFDVD